MKKGDKVKCVDNRGNGWLTNNKTYEIIAGPGDADLCFAGSTVGENCFNIVDDDQDMIFCGMNGPHACFELVEDDGL